ncbi:hypothetical protein D9611_009361 [Ephemerocybe angulata]|uniref:Uncharacterized protein n=1 Tax=Ephemerocybe angulata TaxID=980116 RepID=A0A8H5F493_9AGAR|nr:hypothetical protein D9611_009361 [Tulosesus angulatus]
MIHMRALPSKNAWPAIRGGSAMSLNFKRTV